MERISQWRKDEICALPKDLLSQCLQTIKARERQTLRDRPLVAPPEKIGGMAAPQNSAVRSMFGSDINASCFAERERVRQMGILTVMWTRRFVSQSLPFDIVLLADFSMLSLLCSGNPG